MKIINRIVNRINFGLIAIVLGWSIFVLAMCAGGINTYAQHWIKSQYQNQALKIDVDRVQVNSFYRIMQVDKFDLVFRPSTKNKFAQTRQFIELRDKNNQTVTSFYAGKYYADEVSQKKLNLADNNLLKEKNQTVYQKQKNKLDKIRIWFDQTQDADDFLHKTYTTFQNDPKQLSTTTVSETNAYYKLIKNEKIRQNWTPKVQEIVAYFETNQKNQTKAQMQKEQAELDALKNAPLTDSNYKPANVTIIDNLQNADNISNQLQQAGIKAENVLYYSRSNQTLTLSRRSGNRYVSSLRSLSVRGGSIGTGNYQIQLISNAPETAGVVTDKSNSNFGHYYNDAQRLNMETNTISDFNQAKPLFWLNNNQALRNSILLTNSTTIGFISTASGLSNNLTLSAADLNNLMSNISGSTVLYVN